MAELDVSVTELPVHKVVAPPAVMVGADAVAFTVTTVPVEAAEVQPVVVNLTV